MRGFASWKFVTLLLFCNALMGAASAQIFTDLFNFSGHNGLEPNQTFVQGVDGSFYGTTSGGGDMTCAPPYGCGTIFKISSKGLKTLHTFESSDGMFPYSGLLLANDGNFYGTTLEGGDLTCSPPYGCGTLFKITQDGTLTILHIFESSDGQNPQSPLLQASDGYLYGTTQSGGSPINTNYYGTIFKMTLAGVLTTIHSFDNVDGSGPNELVETTDGKLYGTTNAGGTGNTCSGGCGTIFKMTPNGALTTLHNFNSDDGSHPNDQLMVASDGNLYGTTEEGGFDECNDTGGDGCGTIFKFTPTSTLTTVYFFCSQQGCPDGSLPVSPLIQATDGNLYSTTYQGGNSACPFGCGTVFQITLEGTLTTIHSFNLNDGESAVGGVLQATNGPIYATARDGGKHGDGTVFSINMGLSPFVAFVNNAAKMNKQFGLLGQGFAGTTSVSLNGTPATFTVISDTFIKATVPAGATTGYVTVITPSGTLTSNVPFYVLP